MAVPIETQVTHPQLPPNAPDPNVVVPRHIREAAEAADALHKQAYPEPQPDPLPQPDPPQPDPLPQPDPPITAAVNPDVPVPSAQDMQTDSWAGRYNAMRGRWEASQRQLGIAEQQLRDLAGELQATQRLLEQHQAGARQSTAVPQPQSGHSHENLITQADRDTYGEELIDLAKRAAREAVAGDLDGIRAEAGEAKKRATTTAQADLKVALQQAVPNWVPINRSPEFVRWLNLPNIYSGEVRGKTLRAAYDSANAQRVIAIFQDFVKEVRATGGELPGTQPPQASHQEPPARQAAIALETLAAPGRARPSGGGDPQNLNADKPIYTRAQISANYANKRRGIYNGRDAEWNALDADMIAAGREGRVR